MATLSLRNVPDDLVERLKARAKRHRRSLNSETIATLELADAAVEGSTPTPPRRPWIGTRPWPAFARSRPGFRARPRLPRNLEIRMSCRRSWACFRVFAANSRGLL